MIARLWYRLALRWEDRAWHLVDWLVEEALPEGIHQRFDDLVWPFYHLPLALHLPALALSRRYRAFTRVTYYHRGRLGYLARLAPVPSRDGIYAHILGKDGEA